QLCHTPRIVYLDPFAPSWREFHQLQLAKTRVLVVDDDAAIGHFLRRTMQREGFTVESTLSVAEAWAMIERHDYDLILVDNTMPHESGLVLLQRLQASDYQIPAVLITGDASAE